MKRVDDLDPDPRRVTIPTRWTLAGPHVQHEPVRPCLVCLALVLVGCQAAASAGAACARASECASPLVCRLGRCRAACASSADCPIGARCLLDVSALGACSIDRDERCSQPGAICPVGLVCVDDACVNACAADGDCPPDARCTASTCASIGAADAGVLDASRAGGGSLVISEIRLHDASGAADQFVEVYNPSPAPVALDGCTLLTTTDTNPVWSGLSIGQAILVRPHGYYLFAGTGNTDPLANVTRQPLPEAGGVQLSCDGSADGGVGGTAPVLWGLPGGLDPAPLLAGHSYERKVSASSTSASMTDGAEAHAGNGYVGGGLVDQFVVRDVPEPQSSLAPPEP